MRSCLLRGRRALLALLLGAVSTAPAAAQEVDLVRIEDRVEELRAEWEVPGLALAVVRGDSVLLSRGFGVRSVDAAGPVDGSTLFAIGSTTKAFTSTALAMLVARDSVAWDDPVVEHLPGFVLADPWVSREITIRDLLAHRSGLPMANLMWLPGQMDGDAMIERLRHLEPVAGFRAEMTYQNVLYLVAGRVLEARSGVSWEAFLSDRILDPLGMDRTRVDTDGLDGAPNVASPHARVDDDVVVVPYRDIRAVGPAGSLLSSADDMARWLRFQLGEGSLGEQRLVPADDLLETRRPQIVMDAAGPLSAFYPEARDLAYGMGWVVSEYRRSRLLDHGGGIDGMTALVALVPEHRLGVAILTNLQTAAPPYWILYPVLDVLLGHEPVDRSPPFRALAEQVAAATASRPERVEDAPPSRDLAAYAGEYESAPLGRARVRREEGRLIFELGRLRAPLEPWHFDTFRAPWTDRAWMSAAGPGWVTFRLDRAGRVSGLELSAVPGETWTFERRGR